MGFCHFFLFFSRYFLSRLWEGRYQGYGIITQSVSHMKQLNSVNEGQKMGGDMGVFSGVSDRPIRQYSYFLESTAPTKGLMTFLSQYQPWHFNKLLI